MILIMLTKERYRSYANTFMLFCSLLLSICFVIVFLSGSLSTIYGQLQNQTIGVNITSPERGKTIPINTNLTVSGKSTDNPAADDCQVAVIVNNVKPYQPATANGSTGAPSDYSRWFFVLSSNYTSIKEGVNEITAKLTCLPAATKWYSVNVTGVASTQNITTTTMTSPSQSFTSDQEGLEPRQQPLPKPSPPPVLSPGPEGLPTDDLTIQESMQGGNEPDIIEGTLFADNIDGGNGDDRIQGSGGGDTISGGNGEDYLQGNEGNDNLSGVNGHDTLFGGEGDDTLNGGNGADNFSCGGGTDTIADFSTTQGDVKSDNCEVY
jgi:hemolysin type calcium-binding protein